MLLSGTPAKDTQTQWKRAAKFCAGVSIAVFLIALLALGFHAYRPWSVFVTLAEIFATASLVWGLASAVVGVMHLVMSRREYLRPVLFLLIISLAIFAAHIYIINTPVQQQASNCASQAKQGCVFDESYYVPEALRILQGLPCSTNVTLTGYNCHLEHPFLAKAIMAAGMALFGVTDLGWRISNVVLGTLSIPLLFILVMLVSGNRRLAYASSFFLAVETLFFVHSSIGVLDIPSIFFCLLAFVFYFWRSSFWKIDNLLASGICLGLALLCKETAIFMVLALVSYALYSRKTSLAAAAIDSLKLLIPAVIVSIVGLQIYASLYTSLTTPTFIQEVSYILHYGSGLTGLTGQFSDSFGYITPLRWLVFYEGVPYSVTRVSITVGSVTTTYVSVGYYGITNFLIVWPVFVWAPLVVYGLVKRHTAVQHSGDEVDTTAIEPGEDSSPQAGFADAADREATGDQNLAVFALFWFLWGYFPYIALWIFGRVTYPFYILPAIPALAIGTSYLLTRRFVPPKIIILFAIASFAVFFLYFPVKDFLPIWVRTLLGP